MITFTETAINRINELLAEESDKIKLRMYVQGSGCAGMQYGFTLDENQNEDDFEIPTGGKPVLIDAMSMQYCEGAAVDYVDDLMGSSFKISNPNATTSCGCGSSFGV